MADFLASSTDISVEEKEMSELQEIKSQLNTLIGMMSILLGKSESPKMASDEARKVLARRAKVFKMEVQHEHQSSTRQER